MTAISQRSSDSPERDLGRLLEPISAEQPCGQWLRYEGTYDRVREARREDDAGLPQGVWQSELKRADWESVESICAEALAKRSKDLQLAAWLLEAWIQLDGIGGAARGLELMQRLCVAYWDGMYPALDTEMTARLAPVQWVNEKLPRRLRLLNLTQPTIDDIPLFSLADWDVAVQRGLSQGSGQGAGSTTSNGQTLARFDQSVSCTSYSWFSALLTETQTAIAAARTLDELLDEKAGNLAPGLLKLRDVLNSIEQLVRSMCAATEAQEPSLRGDDSNGVVRERDAPSEMLLAGAESALLKGNYSAEVASEGFMGTGSLHLQTREDAYRVLAQVATFLQNHDPHSPTPYLIWRAVAWGQMEFGELMQELVRDQGELNELARLLHLDISRGARSNDAN
jgi:type VI secretion system ImpA family protein